MTSSGTWDRQIGNATAAVPPSVMAKIKHGHYGSSQADRNAFAGKPNKSAPPWRAGKAQQREQAACLEALESGEFDGYTDDAWEARLIRLGKKTVAMVEG